MSVSLRDWRPPPLPPRTGHQGRSCRLQPLALEHAPGLHAAFEGHPEVWDFLPVGPFEDAGAYAAWVDLARLHHDPLHFCVRTIDGRPSGTLALMNVTPLMGQIEIGWVTFAPRLQRTVAATEAVTLLANWAFEAGYRRLVWKCDALNAASRRAAGRYGFSYEGTHRQASVMKGRNRDTAWFSILDGEWPALRAAWDAWLDPSNFEEGRQRRRLSEMTAPLLATPEPGP